MFEKNWENDKLLFSQLTIVLLVLKIVIISYNSHKIKLENKVVQLFELKNYQKLLCSICFSNEFS